MFVAVWCLMEYHEVDNAQRLKGKGRLHRYPSRLVYTKKPLGYQGALEWVGVAVCGKCHKGGTRVVQWAVQLG
eukprot:scaffold65310_cov17-Tisochrysis_lutea.AAC.1